MALNPGTRLGPYEVLSPAGAGGMGEVYRARDTRLDRTVAIKVLPSHIAATSELRERFEREARTVAALNHPHICTLHDVGQHEDIDFLVMEFLEGETLAERLKRGALLIGEALQYAIQIADALDKAHRAGIIHRDLKPGNIFLTRSGGPSGPPIAKLLDFGLAKTGGAGSGAANRTGGAAALASAIARVSLLPTEATPLTVEGTILGTLQYMAPEQLEGREADARTDIFAFGSVLYEMVTGRRAFQGKSQVSLMAAIIDQEPPPISAAQLVSPPLLEHLVKTCLTKNPDARWQHAGDVLIQLKLIAEQSVKPAQATERASRAAAPWTRVGWIAAAVLLAVSVALAGLMLVGGDVPAPSKISFQVEMPSAPSPLQIAISPDGTRVVALAVAEGGGPPLLWVRALENLDGQALPRTEGAQFPFWSSDGRTIGFFADGKLKKVDLLGAPPLVLCDAPNGHGGTWNRDGVVVFASTPAGPLFQVSAAGGIPVQLTDLDASSGETAHRHPYFLPDGDHFLYTSISSKPEQSAVYVGSLSSKERKRLIPSTLKATFAPPDRLLFMRDNNTLMSQPFDANRLELVGEPFPAVTEDVGINPGNGAAGFAVSANGILAYRSGGFNERVMTWYDLAGKPLGTVGTPWPYQSPAISPDSRRVAVFRQDGRAGDIWVFDLMRGALSRFTFDAGIDTAPIWSPDGSRIVFSSNRSGVFDLYLKNAGGVGQEELLLKSDQSKLADDWSRDGRFILYRLQDAKTAWDLWVLPLDGDRKPQLFLQTPFIERQGRFSPDGRWIAYVSDESGRIEVYVQSFPASGSKWQISTGGGAQPRWRADGKELFFVSSGLQAMAVDVNVPRDGVLAAGVPRRLFQANVVNTTIDRNAWDVTLDGQRFLVNSSVSQAQAAGRATPITVVVNWLAGLGR